MIFKKLNIYLDLRRKKPSWLLNSTVDNGWMHACMHTSYWVLWNDIGDDVRNGCNQVELESSKISTRCYLRQADCEPCIDVLKRDDDN